MEGICKYVFFTYPFGWEELGVVATVAAVIVALVSIHSANKQLIAALRMQEQSKNVSLLEERLKIAEAVRIGKEISTISVKVLFDKAIVDVFEELKDLEMQYNQAMSDETIFFDALKETSSTDVEIKIKEYTENYLERPDCTQSVWKQFQSYCSQHVQYWSHTGFSDDRREYDYFDIYTRMVETHRKVIEKRENVVNLMEEFLSYSIKQVNSTTLEQNKN